jgi:hypothetical protein
MSKFFSGEMRVLLKMLKLQQEQTQKNWNDSVQKRFYCQFLDKYETDTMLYASRLDDFFDLLERSQREIADLVGEEIPPAYGGSAHERGDRAGGISSGLEQNPVILSWMANNGKNK